MTDREIRFAPRAETMGEDATTIVVGAVTFSGPGGDYSFVIGQGQAEHIAKVLGIPFVIEAS